MSYLVKYYMNREAPTTGKHLSALEGAKLMSKLSKGYLVIVKDERPIGIVTEQDLVRKVVAAELDPSKVSLGEIMSSPLITIDPDEDLVKASELMRTNNIRRLPVVKDGVIYGVLTTREISQRFVEYLDKATRDIIKWCTVIG